LANFEDHCEQHPDKALEAYKEIPAAVPAVRNQTVGATRKLERCSQPAPKLHLGDKKLADDKEPLHLLGEDGKYRKKRDFLGDNADGTCTLGNGTVPEPLHENGDERIVEIRREMARIEATPSDQVTDKQYHRFWFLYQLLRNMGVDHCVPDGQVKKRKATEDELNLDALEAAAEKTEDIVMSIIRAEKQQQLSLEPKNDGGDEEDERLKEFEELEPASLSEQSEGEYEEESKEESEAETEGADKPILDDDGWESSYSVQSDDDSEGSDGSDESNNDTDREDSDPDADPEDPGKLTRHNLAKLQEVPAQFLKMAEERRMAKELKKAERLKKGEQPKQVPRPTPMELCVHQETLKAWPAYEAACTLQHAGEAAVLYCQDSLNTHPLWHTDLARELAKSKATLEELKRKVAVAKKALDLEGAQRSNKLINAAKSKSKPKPAAKRKQAVAQGATPVKQLKLTN
jgi:hypothetical protein